MFRSTLVAAALWATFAVSPVLAHDFTVGDLKIGHPWARATPKGASVGGGYLKITNTGTAPDRLVGGASDVASGFEMHEMSMDGGVMKMRQLPKGLEIKPGETVELKPGGDHIMFVGLNKPLEKGQRVDATLEFERAGKAKVYFVVEAIGAPSSSDNGGQSMPGMQMAPGMQMKH